jgi:hypothetical protein
MCHWALNLETICGGLAHKEKVYIRAYAPIPWPCNGAMLRVDCFLCIMKIVSHWVSLRTFLSKTLVFIQAAALSIYPGRKRFTARSLDCELGKWSLVVEVFFIFIKYVCAS